MSEPLRVLIADDHPLFRMGLSYAMKGQGFEIVAEASNGLEAVKAYEAEQPDVVLLDVKMPEMNGIEACKQIMQQDDPPLIVMLTTFDEPAIIHAAREAGAVGFLSKETDPSELARQVRAMKENPERKWLPTVRLPAFTAREAQVLQLLGQGLTNKEMAKKLEISPETIKDYVSNLYGKLEVRDRVSALRRARELGLIS